MRLRRLGGALSVSFLLCGIGYVDIAEAQTVMCGEIITQDTTLDSDVGPCPGDGIIVRGHGITVDLGEHQIVGSGTGTGIVLEPGASFGGSTIRNGAVIGFGTGVALRSNGNTVERLIVQASACEGVFVVGNDNVIESNLIRGSGCSGVRVEGARNTVIRGNVISGNHHLGVHSGNGGLSRTGATSVIGNSISANGSAGVGIFGTTGGHSVVRNSISGNSDGVVLGEFVSTTLVQNNVVVGNLSYGIRLARVTPPDRVGGANRILDNIALDNGTFDLADDTPGCTNNVWAGNRFDTRNQPCVN